VEKYIFEIINIICQNLSVFGKSNLLSAAGYKKKDVVSTLTDISYHFAATGFRNATGCKLTRK
jgi:hypothetical protein